MPSGASTRIALSFSWQSSSPSLALVNDPQPGAPAPMTLAEEYSKDRKIL